MQLALMMVVLKLALMLLTSSAKRFMREVCSLKISRSQGRHGSFSQKVSNRPSSKLVMNPDLVLHTPYPNNMVALVRLGINVPIQVPLT